MAPTPNQTDVFGSDVQSSDESYPACVNCGASAYDAPEGLKPDGSPQWDFAYCYKCGHRDGTDVSDVRKQEREFEEFKAWQQQRYADGSQRGLQPPENAAEADAMRAQIEALQAELSERTKPGYTPPQQAFNPFGVPGQGGNS